MNYKYLVLETQRTKGESFWWKRLFFVSALVLYTSWLCTCSHMAIPKHFEITVIVAFLGGILLYENFIINRISFLLHRRCISPWNCAGVSEESPRRATLKKRCIWRVWLVLVEEMPNSFCCVCLYSNGNTGLGHCLYTNTAFRTTPSKISKTDSDFITCSLSLKFTEKPR